MTKRYDNISAHYEKHVGVDLYDMFRTPNVTSRLHDSAPISTGRFVVIDGENWSTMAYGLDAGLKIQVWKNRVLDQMVFIEARYILQAIQGDFDLEVTFPRGDIERRYAKWHKNYTITLGTYRIWDEEPKVKRNHWFVTLKQEELAYLCQRLEPLKNYVPLPENKWEEI